MNETVNINPRTMIYYNSTILSKHLLIFATKETTEQKRSVPYIYINHQ